MGAGGAIQVVGQFPLAGQPLPSDAAIELAFNRYLLPSSVTRQSFVLHNTSATGPLPTTTPTIAYDPVARIVTITPAPGSLIVDQDAVVVIDATVLRAIDGASLASGQPTVFDFPVQSGDGGTAPVRPQVDYCRDINPIFSAGCAFCHSATGQFAPSGQYADLNLSSPPLVAATAVGKTAHGANTGPTSSPEPPGPIFGVNMPIIDPGDNPAGGGDPAHSWLMYKVLMGEPPANTKSGYTYTSCDGGAYTPTDVSSYHAATQPAFANEANDPERANLANMVSGREMPYPQIVGVSAPLDANLQALTVDELERVSLWIAGGPDGGADAATFLPSGACGCISQ
ncbi:MAG TPA: hypothetical protein VGM06_17150 [Polyangiaceae bacterium]